MARYNSRLQARAGTYAIADSYILGLDKKERLFYNNNY
jgi:hypothetical protein